MHPQKDSAERDALLKALKHAEEEISQARAAQQKAEARVMELSAELHVQRSKLGPPQNGGLHDGSQMPVAQKRAEMRVSVLEAQRRGQQLEFEALQGETDLVKFDNQQLRSQVRAQESQLKAQQKEVEDCKAEVARMRGILAEAGARRQEAPAPTPKLKLEPRPAPIVNDHAARVNEPESDTPAKPESDVGYGSRITYDGYR